MYGSLDSWILYHLMGQNQHLTDISNASKSQLYNPEIKKWDSDLMEEWSVTGLKMPKVLPSQSQFGETHGFVPLRDGIPIHFVAIHQVAAAYFYQIGKRAQGICIFLLNHVF